MMDILYVPMGYIMRFVSALTNNNYLFAVLLFALIIEVLMIPLQIKQQKNSIAQAKLQPKVRAITKKYDGRKDQASMQKKQQEIMDLYQKENFSPYGGCLPMLIQLPVVWALYRVIMGPLSYICRVKDHVPAIREQLANLAHSAGEFEKLEDAKKAINALSEIDVISRLKIDGVLDKVNGAIEGLNLSAESFPSFELFGLDFSGKPSDNLFPWMWIIPVAVFLGMFFSTKIMRKFTYQPPESADVQNGASMKIMNTVFPLMSAWISYTFPAAVGIYWFFRNVISVVEKYFICKAMPIPQMTEEEMKAAEREYGVKKKEKREHDPNKPRPRSLHTIDFDDEPLPPASPDREDDAEVATGKDDPAGDSPVDKAPLKDE